MSSDKGETKSRAELLEAVRWAVYNNSTAAVFFHTAVAEQFGLGASETKTLFILSGGALTAGEVAQQTGLTTPSVTSLIDRLASKGFVHRIHDAKDRRRVIIELDQARFAEFLAVFNALGQNFEPLLERYDDHQLEALDDFLTRLAASARASIEQLRRDAAEESKR